MLQRCSIQIQSFMSETATQTSTEKQTTQQNQFDTLASSVWNEQGTTDASTNQQAAQQQATATTQPEEDVMDINDWIKKELGVDNVDNLKNEWGELRKLKEQPPKPEEIKFANEESQKAFEYLKEGKRSDLYKILEKQERLDRFGQLENPNTYEATEILKTHLQYKNPNLTPDQIDFLIEENYAKPQKPVQSLEETEEDYTVRVSEWEKQVERVNKKLVIDSKIAQPELSKLKTEIVFPDIQKAAATQPEPTPEEVAELQKRQTAFSQSVDESLKSFNSLKVNYKDEAVELPINYEVSNEEKAAVKDIVHSLYNSWDYFGKRWANQDGSINTNLMAEDIYWLENRARVAQKFVNETGAQIKLAEMKQRNNINFKDGNSNGGSLVPEKTNDQQQAEAIWRA